MRVELVRPRPPEAEARCSPHAAVVGLPAVPLDAFGVRGYQRHRPETTTLYAVVRDNVETLYAPVATGFEGAALSPFVRRELDGYLDCGLLCHGSARLKCVACAEKHLVAFSPVPAVYPASGADGDARTGFEPAMDPRVIDWPRISGSPSRICAISFAGAWPEEEIVQQLVRQSSWGPERRLPSRGRRRCVRSPEAPGPVPIADPPIEVSAVRARGEEAGVHVLGYCTVGVGSTAPELDRQDLGGGVVSCRAKVARAKEDLSRR